MCGLPVDNFGFQGGNPHKMHACIADPLLSPKPGFATDMSVYTPPPPATCRSEPWCIARIPFVLVHSSVCYLRHFEVSHIMCSLHFNSFAYWPKGYLALVMGIFSLWYRDSPPPPPPLWGILPCIACIGDSAFIGRVYCNSCADLTSAFLQDQALLKPAPEARHFAR